MFTVFMFLYNTFANFHIVACISFIFLSYNELLAGLRDFWLHVDNCNVLYVLSIL